MAWLLQCFLCVEGINRTNLEALFRVVFPYYHISSLGSLHCAVFFLFCMTSFSIVDDAKNY